MRGNESQAEAGAWVVLIFWPNSRLVVLIVVMFIEKSVYHNVQNQKNQMIKLH